MSLSVRYPGDGARWVICDICGRKTSRSQVILVNDPYGPQHGMLVCKDEVSLVSAGMKPYTVGPEKRPDVKYVRPEQPFQYSNAQTISDVLTSTGSYSTGRTPQAPSELQVYVDFQGYTTLSWLLLGSPGSTSITGHKIERESPVGGGWSTLVADTDSGAQLYQDRTTVAGNTYNYRISAINESGIGDASIAKSITL